MDWKEYSVKTNNEAEELVSDFLIQNGSVGVSILNRNDLSSLKQNLDTLWDFDDHKFPETGVIIKGYFSMDDISSNFNKYLHEQLEYLKKNNSIMKYYKVESTQIATKDWENNWKEYYHPVQVTRYLTIVPEWEYYEKRHADEQLLIMDPGLAFGTGTHPTTQLSLQALELVLRGGETVIDVGTGSGVLTIASSVLDAKKIYAYDLDDMAVKSAEENIQLNNLSTEIIVQQNNLLNDVIIKADVIVANILANIILELIPNARKNLNKNGYFIVSGILSNQKEQIIQKMKQNNFKIIQINEMENWVIIISKKLTKENY